MLTPIRKPTLTRGRYAYHTHYGIDRGNGDHHHPSLHSYCIHRLLVLLIETRFVPTSILAFSMVPPCIVIPSTVVLETMWVAALTAHYIVWQVMGGIVLWIVFLEYVSRGFLPDFHARKLCHAGCGLGIMMLDSHHLVALVARAHLIHPHLVFCRYAVSLCG